MCVFLFVMVELITVIFEFTKIINQGGGLQVFL